MTLPRARALKPFTLLRDEALRFALRTTRRDCRHRDAVSAQREPVVARLQAAFENDLRQFRRRLWEWHKFTGRRQARRNPHCRRRRAMDSRRRREKPEKILLLPVGAHVMSLSKTIHARGASVFVAKNSVLIITPAPI